MPLSTEKVNISLLASNTLSLHGNLPIGGIDTAAPDSMRNCLPLSDNNVSTTNDSLIERNWDLPCETDDINVSN